MRLTRFRRLVDAHGPELTRWPVGAQRAAQRLLAADPAARAALERARRLGDLLAHAPAPPASEAQRRVLAALDRLPAQQSPYWWPAPIQLWDLLPRWPRAAALVAMAVLGILVGFTDLGGTAPASSADVSGLIFDPNPAIGLGQ